MQWRRVHFEADISIGHHLFVQSALIPFVCYSLQHHMATRCVQVTELVGLSRCRTIRVGPISAFLSKDDGHPLGHPSGSPPFAPLPYR